MKNEMEEEEEEDEDDDEEEEEDDDDDDDNTITTTTSWSQTVLESFERILNTKMTKACMHHKNCSSERFILPQNVGGAGITDIDNLHSQQVKSLRTDFDNKKNFHLHQIICDTCTTFTPLNKT
jgi:pyridoxine/pyridoxamine 5'-phosphate oxidase